MNKGRTNRKYLIVIKYDIFIAYNSKFNLWVPDKNMKEET